MCIQINKQQRKPQATFFFALLEFPAHCLAYAPILNYDSNQRAGGTDSSAGRNDYVFLSDQLTGLASPALHLSVGHPRSALLHVSMRENAKVSRTTSESNSGDSSFTNSRFQALRE